MDSALFRELGEHLVGQPHIALAELVKNSYDADATEVRVVFGRDSIEVADNGNGMTFDEFCRFWMRVGTPHKQDERVSHRFSRPMTGSKGVGRLAAQFLASRLEVRTHARVRGADEILAEVDWNEAVKAGELTRAMAQYTRGLSVSEFPGQSTHGTSIALSGLQHRWTEEELINLAREVWWLQPPFDGPPDRSKDAVSNFRLVLEHSAKKVTRQFDEQMRAAMELWYARITGRIARQSSGAAQVEISLVFDDGAKHATRYELSDCALEESEFEIRVFALANRQAKGIKVEQAREYLKRFGGVHVYDAGFHLPYYGPDTDWLHIEMDHSHRLSKSALLPATLQVANGMNNLPTQSRVLGAVRVNTATEQASGLKAHRRDYLKIQVSRDRLVDNRAFTQLRDAVRWSLDYYAMEETRRKLALTKMRRNGRATTRQISRIERVLKQNRQHMPKPLFDSLRQGLTDVAHATTAQAEANTRSMGLLGALATSGMVAIASQNEAEKQFEALDRIAREMDRLRGSPRLDRTALAKVAQEVRAWTRQARASRELFSHLAGAEARSTVRRYKARSFIEDVRDHLGRLVGDASIDVTGVLPSERLPPGTYAEWSALFQNVLLNAAAAVVSSKEKNVVISSISNRSTHRILVQDTGRGVVLEDSARLFEPFERGSPVAAGVDKDRKPSDGIGLTIVRMVAQDVGCGVDFTKPAKGFATAFQLSWNEE